MLKTNSKKAREHVREYIMDHVCVDGYDIAEPETVTEAARIIYNNFRSTHQWAIDHYGEFTAFSDWCAGLPSILDTCYFYNRSAVDDLAAILEETEQETSRYTEQQAERVLTLLIYREIRKEIERK